MSPNLWLLLVGLGSSALLACQSSPHKGTDADAAAACQTPSGQLEEWQPADGAVIPGGDMPGGMGADARPMGVDGGGVGTGARSMNDAVIPDETGEATTFFFDQFRQFALEPDTQTALIDPLPDSNGRGCETCHQNRDGWQINPKEASQRFYGGVAPVSPSNSAASRNDELDPLFRTNDGTTSPNADVSTPAAREVAYALLLGKGLIRVGLPMPDAAEFSLVAVDDPYQYASANELSLYRRPLPMMNLRFLTTVMWDGRQTLSCETMLGDLASQADDAARTHAQVPVPLSEHQKQMITDRERIIYFAQSMDNAAGPLDADGALGGPEHLQRQEFYYGMNAFPGPDPRGGAYTPRVFTLFDAWSGLSESGDARAAARLAIVRGQALFNTRTFSITDVKGFNDDLGIGSVQGTCSTCHDAPNVGHNSLGRLMDIGVSEASRRTADIPLYTFVNKATTEARQVTDPGRGLITGAWNDIGCFKVPNLRGLPFHPPYFHDGSQASVMDVVNYIDGRFSIGLTSSEKSDLVAFLNAL
jgi:hypothetical protein